MDEIPNLAFCEVDRSAHDVGDKTLAALVQQVVQPVARNINGADLRPEIQRHRVGQARIVDEGLLVLDHYLAAIDNFHEKPRRVVFQGARVDAEAAGIAAADIRMVQHIADPHKYVFVTEQRACDDYVVLVERAQKWVVGHEDIAVLDTLPAVDDGGERIAHRRNVNQTANTRRDQLGIARKQSHIEVVALHYDRRSGNGLDYDALFVIDLPQPVFDDFEGYGVGHGAAPSPIEMLPKSSISALQPGGIQTVVVSRSTIAGPAIAAPGAIVRKSTIAQSTKPVSRR